MGWQERLGEWEVGLDDMEVDEVATTLLAQRILDEAGYSANHEEQIDALLAEIASLSHQLLNLHDPGPSGTFDAPPPRQSVPPPLPPGLTRSEASTGAKQGAAQAKPFPEEDAVDSALFSEDELDIDLFELATDAEDSEEAGDRLETSILPESQDLDGDVDLLLEGLEDQEPRPAGSIPPPLPSRSSAPLPQGGRSSEEVPVWDDDDFDIEIRLDEEV